MLGSRYALIVSSFCMYKVLGDVWVMGLHVKGKERGGRRGRSAKESYAYPMTDRHDLNIVTGRVDTQKKLWSGLFMTLFSQECSSYVSLMFQPSVFLDSRDM